MPPRNDLLLNDFEQSTSEEVHSMNMTNKRNNDEKNTAISTRMTASTSDSRPTNEQVLNVAFYSFVGFMLVQAVFAVIANSESMLADSEAMSVDAITYLFNLCAERIKNRPSTEAEMLLTVKERSYRREVRRLYLEMIPPKISVLALISITIYTLNEACETLFGGTEDEESEDVSVPIMLLFSGVNLLLDVVNVTCFARAEMNFGLNVVRQEQSMINSSFIGASAVVDVENETSNLLVESSPRVGSATYGSSQAIVDNSDQSNGPGVILVNLNMCSAWTHVCADTLRSTAVLIAAGIATAMPSVDGALADALASIAVSVIILISLIPLLQGLVLTGLRLRTLQRNHMPVEEN